jgi:multiple sugar transport system permease protein
LTLKKASIYIILTVCLIISIFPFFWLILTSLKPGNEVLEPSFLIVPIFDNYVNVLTDAKFLNRLGTSLFISIMTVIITVPIGCLGGYAFARLRFKKKDNYFFMLLTTRMAPPVAFGVPFYLMLSNNHLVDTFTGLISAYVFMNLAFCIWLTRGFFEEIPYELEEAAYMDGCSKLTSFIRITIPLSVGGIITTSILMFIITWNEFFFASILTRNEVATFTVHLTTFFGSRRIDWGELAAASTIVSIIPIFFAIITRKFIVRGFSLGAVKNSK